MWSKTEATISVKFSAQIYRPLFIFENSRSVYEPIDTWDCQCVGSSIKMFIDIDIDVLLTVYIVGSGVKFHSFFKRLYLRKGLKFVIEH